MSRTDLTLLLVEDNDIDVIVVRRLMRRLGIDLPVVRADNGETALDLLRTPSEPPRLSPPYVIVLDLNMPRMTGFEFLDAIAGDAALASVPIFILSTSSHPADKRRARDYRIRGYFVKPLDERGLREVIGSIAA